MARNYQHDIANARRSLPDWFARASCRTNEVAVDTFFPDGDDQLAIARAKQVCARCPIEHACLQYALDTHQRHGIWGGATENERRRIRRHEQRAAR